MQTSDIMPSVVKTTNSTNTYSVELSPSRIATLVLPSDLNQVEVYDINKLISNGRIATVVLNLCGTDRTATLMLPPFLSSGEINKLTYVLLCEYPID